MLNTTALPSSPQPARFIRGWIEGSCGVPERVRSASAALERVAAPVGQLASWLLPALPDAVAASDTTPCMASAQGGIHPC